MGKRYTYEEFLGIIKALRSENGCPWDREQTHDSLRPCIMEEAAEFVAAIRIYHKTGNAENMCEELGDLLLQIVMHSEIADEEGLFSMEDVVNEVATKMVRRHPHVFGDVEADTSEQVLKNWDEIKKKEKEGKEWIESPLREIPPELPSLTRAPKVLKKIDKLYEKGNDYETSLHNLQRNVERISCEQDEQRISETIGDILMNLSDISRIKKLPLEQILNDKIEDLIERFENQ